jgi:hypothetical protein
MFFVILINEDHNVNLHHVLMITSHIEEPHHAIISCIMFENYLLPNNLKSLDMDVNAFKIEVIYHKMKHKLGSVHFQ